MPKHLYALTFLTFLMGAVSGVYVYFISREPDTPSSGDDTEQSGYEIVATTYGGCERIGCTSLRILDDGTYTYLVNGGVDGYGRYDGELSSAERKSLTKLVEGTDFTELVQTVYEGTCPITYDGVAYQFVIRSEAFVYELDSCEEALDEEPLFDELVTYFDMMNEKYQP
jgi:hypothetical protein